MENPLPYDEFLNFDQILANLIKRLEQVESAYKKMTDDVVADAKTMKAAMEKAASSGALDDAALAQNTREVDKLTKAYNNYNTAMSETAKEIARLQQATREENRLSALAAKSVTTPIAMEVTRTVGGISSLTAAVVVCVGLFGALFGFQILRLLRIKTPPAQGLSMGAAAHAVGTDTAMGVGQTHGAYASLGLILNGLFTSILTPYILQWCNIL